MATTFEKLNLKDQQSILVLNAPASFEPELSGLKGIKIHRSLDAVPESPFSLAFVTRKSEVDALAAQVAKRAKGDAIVWFAYPKGTSKKYKCDFNRDTGWDAMSKQGSKRCVPWQSTKTGRPFAFDGMSSSKRAESTDVLRSTSDVLTHYFITNNPGSTSPALPSTTFVNACAFSGGSGPI